jgi:hypothetical protein
MKWIGRTWRKWKWIDCQSVTDRQSLGQKSLRRQREKTEREERVDRARRARRARARERERERERERDGGPAEVDQIRTRSRYRPFGTARVFWCSDICRRLFSIILYNMDFKSFNLGGSGQSSRSLLSSSSQMMQNAASGIGQGSKSMSLGLNSLTKSVSGAVSSLPNLPTLSTEKKKNEEKQQQIAFVMSLLEDVRLQSPATHTGFVVAFSTATVSPVSNPHVKFRWFKMNSLVPDQFHQVDESSRAWYPPTADDIGCKICVQCEDKLGQGFSRYIEVGRRIGWGYKPF